MKDLGGGNAGLIKVRGLSCPAWVVCRSGVWFAGVAGRPIAGRNRFIHPVSASPSVLLREDTTAFEFGGFAQPGAALEFLRLVSAEAQLPADSDPMFRTLLFWVPKLRIVSVRPSCRVPNRLDPIATARIATRIVVEAERENAGEFPGTEVLRLIGAASVGEDVARDGFYDGGSAVDVLAWLRRSSAVSRDGDRPPGGGRLVPGIAGFTPFGSAPSANGSIQRWPAPPLAPVGGERSTRVATSIEDRDFDPAIVLGIEVSGVSIAAQEFVGSKESLRKLSAAVGEPVFYSVRDYYLVVSIDPEVLAPGGLLAFLRREKR